MGGLLGIEPRLTGSKPAALPLSYRPKKLNVLLYISYLYINCDDRFVHYLIKNKK